MIHHPRYAWITTEYRRFSAPHAATAERFDARLFKACRCHLYWHRQRRTFLVMRDVAAHAHPQMFFDIKSADLPFTDSLLRKTISAVDYYDAARCEDPERMLDSVTRESDDRWEIEKRGFIDTYVPEFTKDLRRGLEVLGDGTYRHKYFDLATAK